MNTSERLTAVDANAVSLLRPQVTDTNFISLLTPAGETRTGTKMSQDASSFHWVLIARQICQTDSTRIRSAISELRDPCDVFAPWAPSTRDEHVVQTLERLPGLARAIEVWERDLPAGDQDLADGDGAALFYIPCSSALDALDPDEVPWRGPDPLDEWEREWID